MAKYPTIEQMGKEVLESINITVERETSLTLMECVDRRIPKKIIHMPNNTVVCGQCKQSITPRQAYCDTCGQRLDWSE